MRVLGLTGGVGMGKSTAATLLAQHDVTIVDTDVLAHQLVEPGQPALAEIQHAFGPDMLADGSLRRDLLAQRVFSDSAARKNLEAILHPRIRKLWQSQLALWRASICGSPPLPKGEGWGEEERTVRQPTLHTEAASARYFCVVIPLLFETQAETEFDATICVACSPLTQQQRLSSRGWNAEQISQRIQAQLPVEEKLARADYVVWNEGSLEVLNAQLERVLRSADRAP